MGMLMLRKGFFISAIALATPALASAQAVKSYAGEVVMKATGELAAGWQEMRMCVTQERCAMAVYNPTTREVARFGDRWATKFAPTGNGQEVQRAESAMAKAVRLKGPAKQ
jgi:hypothetical protein